MQDLRSRHVQQPARAHGVLELFRGFILFELQRGRERHVSELSAGAVVARGQSELQLVSDELARSGKQRVSEQLRLRRGVHGAERGNLFCMRCRQLQGLVRREPVRGVPGWHVLSADRRELLGGVRELLGRDVLGRTRRELSGGVRELPGELARCGRERVFHQLRLRRGVHRAERRRVLAVRCRFLQERGGQRELHGVLDRLLGIGWRKHETSMLSGR